MIPIEEMKNSIGKDVTIVLVSGKSVQGHVESFEYEVDEDEEPMLLVNSNLVFSQSEISSIKLVNTVEN